MVIVTTVAWWALAIWPVPEGGPDWVLRTRAVCFGSTDSGLPAVEGWLLLIFQPTAMTVALLMGWGQAAREALAMVVRTIPGRLVTGVTVGVLVLGAGGTIVRVASAMGKDVVRLGTPATAPVDHARMDRPAPTALALADQSGVAFSLAQHRGRPVLLTFAFARCTTVCPVLVREVLEAQRLAPSAGAARPAVVVLTVDPWRDPPSRLAHVAEKWSLGEDAHVLSGPVDAVLSELDAWAVSIQRDQRTGDVVHPALVYVLDPEGRIAFVTTGGGQYVAELLARL